jgi:6-phosphogluconolactonase
VSSAANEWGVYGYSIAATTGVLVPLAGNPFPLATTGYPSAVIVDPQGRFVLTANNHVSDPEVAADGVSVSAIDPVTGALALVPGSPFAAGYDAVSVAVDPTGKFVYVLNAENYPGSISAFSIDSMTGALTPVAGVTAEAGANPINITVDPRGAFVYVACPDGVWAFAIDGATGALSPVAGNQFAPGVASPVAFAITN